MDKETVIQGLESLRETIRTATQYTFTSGNICAMNMARIDNAITLLKEQEAAKPVEEFIKGTNCHKYHCKRCGNIVGNIFDDKHPIFPGAKVSIKHFCDVCGQAVKWE